MQTLISPATAEQIVRTVSDISGRDINFISPDGTIIASTDQTRVGTYHEIGHRAAAERRTFEVQKDESYLGTREGVNLPFLWKGETAAVIGITGIPDEVRKYAQLAQRITRLILKERELELLDHRRQAQAGYIVRQLIRSEKKDLQLPLDYLRQNGFHEDARLRIIVARISARYNPANLTLAEDEIFRVFRTSGSPLFTFLYPDQYVLILNDSSYRSIRPDLGKLASDMQAFLTIGVGNVETLQTASYSYQSAMQCAAGARATPGQLAEYEHMHAELLLGTVSKESMRIFVSRVLSGLSEKDQQYLEAYFRCNCSLKAAAAELFIHKNTLQYHLDRIRDLSGFDPRLFTDASDLMLALRCQSFLKDL